MPSSPKKHCPRGHEAYLGRRCPECEKKRDLKRGNSNSRGYDQVWREVARSFLKENPICSKPNCLEFATDVDHIKPLSEGGAKLDKNNFRGFCHRHHSQRTGRDNVKARGQREA